MKHTPTLLDASSDLRRCVYASFSKHKFDDPVFKDFFDHAKSILKKYRIHKSIINRLNKSQDKKIDDNKRREDLLTASILLQNS